ncbi:MAG TPA: aminotransferase class III-fold pyridoxal phosphate-dependent enzyme [Acidimicrobiales bacterium]|nr:aminotransferase class III-fold pyridoxal phosphate-dependent enzyme [Acidimicrobiales bacterium]
MTAVVAPTSTEEWLARYDEAVAGVLPTYFDVVADHAEGSWITDVGGRRYLDFGSGIAVTNVGHCHPRVVAAVQRQAARLLHTSVVLRHQPYITLAERIGALCPFLDDPQVFLCNSGAEAVDGAIKLARRVTGRAGIVAFDGAFHGRTLAATTLTTTRATYREGYDPLLPGVHVAPHGDLTGFDELLATIGAATVAAVIVEPVLGEGGYVLPPAGWLAGLRQRCDDHGVLLVFDEVQCGMGRTGRPFAAETFGVAPDVVLFAKGVASGLPLGGIVAGRALMDRWSRGSHGSTFGGNPVSCAAALATLDVLADEDCYERATVLGRRALARLAAVDAPWVVDVRGVGLMIGVELTDGATAVVVQRRCLDAGLIVLNCGPDGRVLRLVPPLTISDADLTIGLDILCQALRRGATGKPTGAAGRERRSP